MTKDHRCVVDPLDWTAAGCFWQSLAMMASIYLLQSGHCAGPALSPRKHLQKQTKEKVCHGLCDTSAIVTGLVVYLLVLSTPGTTVLALFLGGLNRPVALVRWRGEKVVGPWSYGSSCFQRSMILKAWSFVSERSLVLVRETKYVANASTLLNPPMLSGPTESWCERKRNFIYTTETMLFYTLKYLWKTDLQVTRWTGGGRGICIYNVRALVIYIVKKNIKESNFSFAIWPFLLAILLWLKALKTHSRFIVHTSWISSACPCC